MRHIFFLLLVSLVVGCNSKSNFDPDVHLTANQKQNVFDTIVRYIGKLPEKATAATRFEKKYDEYYRVLQSQFQLKQYYIDDSCHYFLVWRPAPSLQEKFVATGGKLKVDDFGNVIEFEEVFRTWKMVSDTLGRRGNLLFEKMVKGESLEVYLTSNSKIEYIEFPDEYVFYDKKLRCWRSSQFGSVEEMDEKVD